MINQCGLIFPDESRCQRPGTLRRVSELCEARGLSPEYAEAETILCEEHYQALHVKLAAMSQLAEEAPRLLDNLLHPRIAWKERIVKEQSS